ncbi:hypothetical protein L227DRAFT_396755 [Lentinus tigrinus ALCF2SS1-6]|uniref:Uncharacterized protein n=1 Tax=Lentinus tigrinus ALCF2SS1-6 TaxID=1328759 RepID=A0A5C2RPY1_9APHY|nr:hypothetical protein L227DRAFT_396755 [Lentinus tigrinus ALCF2SS1-6]
MGCCHRLPHFEACPPHLQDCTATLVILSAPLPQPSNHQFLLNAIDKATGWNQALSRSAKGFLLSKLASAEGAGCHVHAEAGLMALDAHLALRRLQSTRLAADVQKIATVFEHVGSLPIGITKKCCWACFRLAQLLTSDIRSDFLLPGSHGVIYPWSPPPFGVSPKVLSILRDELMGRVVQWATEQVDYIDASRQSSSRFQHAVISKATWWN